MLNPVPGSVNPSSYWGALLREADRGLVPVEFRRATAVQLPPILRDGVRHVLPGEMILQLDGNYCLSAFSTSERPNQ